MRRYGDVVELLLRSGCNTNVENRDGESLLAAVVAEHDLGTVQLLLDFGARPEGGSNRSALHRAVWGGVAEQVAKASLLATAASGLDILDQDGHTPLGLAVQTGEEAIVRAYLEAGASASLADRRGWTALHFAADSKDADRLLGRPPPGTLANLDRVVRTLLASLAARRSHG